MPTPSAEVRVLHDAVCTACGLLCDDITLTVSDDRIIEANRACHRGRSWFLADYQVADLPPASVDGNVVSVAEAIDRAASLLANASAPVLTGLTSATLESQSLSARLADRIGATISPNQTQEATPRILAIQRAGATLASFGEVMHRANVILLWGVDPAETHPRLRERLIDPPGRFVPEGRAGRTVLVVDAGTSECRTWADEAIAVTMGRHSEAIQALRAAVRGVAADLVRLEQHTGSPVQRWQSWANLLRTARYGAIIFGAELTREGASAIEALMRLIDDLNTITRCVAVPLAGPGNPAGAEAILTGRLGAPVSVDLADGIARYRPFDADPELRLRSGEADALLVVGEFQKESASNRPEGLPTILVGPNATDRSAPGVVALATAIPGIDDGGIFCRSDEVTLPLRPVIAPRLPSMNEVLARLLEHCESRAQGSCPSRPLSAGAHDAG
ncbi:molybdopterin-binding domain-containing protein [Tautonia rosea]|uniref:formylmethanofuran dehydrogenase subunit B n=1 Tax=Tautonia rosea TaxID=2728037 RepID=UPI001474F1A6|nr:formylmethanofuran dehydrogenase subunit B [Tautonia rosea]